MFKNVLIKLSGEALQGAADKPAPGEPPKGKAESFRPPYDASAVDAFVSEIVRLTEAGVRVSIVVGGGNYGRGRSADAGLDRAVADQIGMLGTVMNGLYLTERFRLAGKRAVCMTPVVIAAWTELFEKKRAIACQNDGAVLIFAAGSGLPFLSTDTICAIRAGEMECDAVLFAKNGVDGVYSADPKDPGANAEKFPYLSYSDYLKMNLQAIDAAAISICKERGLFAVAFDSAAKDALRTVASGDEEEILKIGTILRN